jgi:hypothetical protein
MRLRALPGPVSVHVAIRNSWILLWMFDFSFFYLCPLTLMPFGFTMSPMNTDVPAALPKSRTYRQYIDEARARLAGRRPAAPMSEPNMSLADITAALKARNDDLQVRVGPVEEGSVLSAFASVRHHLDRTVARRSARRIFRRVP